MIPKIIHYCWLSNDPFPPAIKKCIESWKTKLPDYEFMFWDANRFDIDSTIWTKQAFEVNKYAFASDYIRLYALYNYGGIYLDCDVEVLKNFDDFLELPYFIGSQYDNLIEAAVLGATKKSEWLYDCLEYYKNRSFIKKDGSYDLLILPVIIENQIKKKREIHRIKLNQIGKIKTISLNKKQFYILPYEIFSPKNHQTGEISDLNNSYTIHHYQNSWLPLVSRLRLKLIKFLGINNVEIIIKTFKIREVFSKIKLFVKK